MKNITSKEFQGLSNKNKLYCITGFTVIAITVIAITCLLITYFCYHLIKLQEANNCYKFNYYYEDVVSCLTDQ